MQPSAAFYCLFLICAILSNISKLEVHHVKTKRAFNVGGIGLILTAITPVLPLAYATPVGALVEGMWWHCVYLARGQDRCKIM